MQEIMDRWRQSVLLEMRAPIRFPDLDRIEMSRPDQEIMRPTSEREKKILVKKVSNALEDYYEEYGDYPFDGSTPQKARENLKKFLQKAFQHGKGGFVLRNNPEFKEKLQKHGVNLGYFGDVEDPRTTQQHEGMHYLFAALAEEYGAGAWKAVIEEIIDIMREEMDDTLGIHVAFVGDGIGYDPFGWQFEEEMIANAYSLLNAEQTRQKAKKFVEDKYPGWWEEYMSRLKSAWKKVINFTRNLDERELIQLMKKHD